MSGGLTLDQLVELVVGFREFEAEQGVTITRLRPHLNCDKDDPKLVFYGDTEKGECLLGVRLTN